MSRTPYEAFLFDMDGVIIDTQEAVRSFWLALADKYGIALTPIDFTRHIYGCAANHTLDALFPMIADRERESLHAEMMDYEINQPYTALPGALALLHTLQAHGIPTALVTSGAQFKVKAVSEQLALDGLFSVTVTADSIRHSKPHPEGYLKAAQRLGKSAQRCIVFEDALSGVEAACAAGALCIGVSDAADTGLLRQAGAACVVPNLTHIRINASNGQHHLQITEVLDLPLLGLV